MRARRRSLAPADHARRSRLAAGSSPGWPRSGRGAASHIYLPFDGRRTPRALIAAARRRGIRIYVPVVVDLRHRRLRFYPLEGRTRRGDVRHLRAAGIAHGRRSAPRWFDLIVVPLVGVDAQGRRLGMGGGFYDRALAFRRHRRIGAARGWSGSPSTVSAPNRCFAEAWDVSLDALATESGLQHFPRGDCMNTGCSNRNRTPSASTTLAPARARPPRGTECAITRRATCCGTP